MSLADGGRGGFGQGRSVRVAAARVRVNAITASTSQAQFAVKAPEGRCAEAEFLTAHSTGSTAANHRWIRA